MRLSSARSLLLAGHLGFALAFLSAGAHAGAPGAPGTTRAPTGETAVASEDSARAAAAFDLQIAEQTIAGAGQIFRCYLTTERGKFSFVLPSGLRVNADATNKTITLTSSDYTCAIDLQVIEGKGQSAPQADALRPVVLRRFPGAALLGEFVATAAGRNGPGFDLERPAAQERKLCTRIAFVPFHGGMLEFNLTAPPDKFSSFQHRLNQLLLSFRAGTHQQPVEVQAVIPD